MTQELGERVPPFSTSEAPMLVYHPAWRSSGRYLVLAGPHPAAAGLCCACIGSRAGARRERRRILIYTQHVQGHLNVNGLCTNVHAQLRTALLHYTELMDSAEDCTLQSSFLRRTKVQRCASL